LASLRPMADCGRAARWQLGWQANSASHRSRRSGAGKRCKRSAGRSRHPVQRTPNRLRPKRRQHLKKARGCRRRSGGKAPRQAGRGRHGRAPHWPEARHAPRLGADRRTSNRAWPSPVRLALCHGVCLTGDRRNLLVCFQRSVEGIFRGAACNLRTRSRSRLEPHCPSRARQCGVASAS
jgi:hypothetical protein